MDWEHRSKGLIPTLMLLKGINPFFSAVNVFKMELQVYFLYIESFPTSVTF